MHNVLFSEERDKLLSAIADTKSSLNKVQTNALNPHFNSPYANLEAVNYSLLPIMKGNGLEMFQFPIRAEGDFPAIAMTALVSHSESGQWCEFTTQLPLAKAGAQEFTSGITYLRRYQKLCVFDILTGDDDGNTAQGLGTGYTMGQEVLVQGKNDTKVGIYKGMKGKLAQVDLDGTVVSLATSRLSEV
jgi:hypothetical protein